MKANRLLLFTVGIVTFLAGASAHAGPWTKPQYHFYLQLGSAFTIADNRYDADGNSVPIQVRKYSNDVTTNVSNFQQLLTDLYFEYGIFDRLTIFGDFPFLNSMRQLNPGGDITYSTNGISDLLLGLRVGVLLEPITFSVEARLTFPTGDVNAVIPAGTGDYRGELRLLGGKIWTKKIGPGSISLITEGEFGFTLRGNAQVKTTLMNEPLPINYAPEVYIRGELDLVAVFRRYAMRQVILGVWADYRTSTSRPTALDPEAGFTIIPPNSRLATINVGLMWYLLKYAGVNLRYTQAVAGARLPVISQAAAALFVDY